MKDDGQRVQIVNLDPRILREVEEVRARIDEALRRLQALEAHVRALTPREDIAWS